MAIWRHGKPDALLHHFDRGSQYTGEQFQRLMAGHGVVCSMSRSGNAWDNVAMESFFSNSGPSAPRGRSIEREMTQKLTSSIILSEAQGAGQ